MMTNSTPELLIILVVILCFRLFFFLFLFFRRRIFLDHKWWALGGGFRSLGVVVVVLLGVLRGRWGRFRKCWCCRCRSPSHSLIFFGGKFCEQIFCYWPQFEEFWWWTENWLKVVFSIWGIERFIQNNFLAELAVRNAGFFLHLWTWIWFNWFIIDLENCKCSVIIFVKMLLC